MSFHEKHQYFYEKYLRNEMSEKERTEFEEKLLVDEQFKYSFHHYKNHRNQYLNDRIIEDKIEYKKRWKLSPWLYLTISVSGIILYLSYQLFKNEKITESTETKTNSWNLINPIPFFNNKDETHKSQVNIKLERNNLKIKTDSSDVGKQTAPESIGTNSANEENTDFANDIMELDSFISAYDKNYFDQRYKSIRSETDSIIVDSLMEMLTAKSAGRNLQQSKPKTIYVEFWHSPINFKGYKFNGKKLIIYGIVSPYEIYLLRDSDELILRTTHTEFVLTNDNNFHKF